MTRDSGMAGEQGREAAMRTNRHKRVSLNNNKGGAMKTALTLGLAEAVAAMGLSVLVVDMDPQANASRRLGVPFNPANPTPTISEAIQKAESGLAAQVIRPCGWESEYADRIWVAPSRFDLENRISEASVTGAVRRLDTVLDGADDDFDIVLVDCPPSLGHLTQLAFAAVGHALIATAPEYDDVEGAVRTRDFIALQAANLYNPDLALLGVITTRVRSNIGAHRHQLEGMTDLFGDTLWSPQIPERAAVKDANDAAVPIRSLRGGAEVAGLIDDHAKHLVRKLGIAL